MSVRDYDNRKDQELCPRFQILNFAQQMELELTKKFYDPENAEIYDPKIEQMENLPDMVAEPDFNDITVLNSLNSFDQDRYAKLSRFTSKLSPYRIYEVNDWDDDQDGNPLELLDLHFPTFYFTEFENTTPVATKQSTTVEEEKEVRLQDSDSDKIEEKEKRLNFSDSSDTNEDPHDNFHTFSLPKSSQISSPKHSNQSREIDSDLSINIEIDNEIEKEIEADIDGNEFNPIFLKDLDNDSDD